MPVIERSPNGRACCQICRNKIQTDDVRVSVKTAGYGGFRASGGSFSSKYHHVGCYSRGDPCGFYGFEHLDSEAKWEISDGGYGAPYLPSEEEQQLKQQWLTGSERHDKHCGAPHDDS